MENTSDSTKALVNNEIDNDTCKISNSDAGLGNAENNNSPNSTSTTPLTVTSPLTETIKPIDSETIEQPTEIKAHSEETDKTVGSDTPPALNDDNVTNASTEVLLDVSISDRLSALSIAGDESPIKTKDLLESSKPDDETSEKANSGSPRKTEKSAELCRSILAGEVSDNSECSVEEDEASDYVDDKVVSGDVSDEEMFIEDEDVEEEEEFHEVEEEKHKTSQESVGDVKAASSIKVAAKSSPVAEKITPPPNQSSISTSEGETNKDLVVDTVDHVENLSPSRGKQPTPDHETPPVIVASDETAREEDKIADKSKGSESIDSKSPTSKATDWVNLMQSKEDAGTNDVSKDESVETKPADLNEESEDAEKTTDVEKVQDGEKLEDVEKKELDLDEDVKNPQYIPKKGVFYEHDDRSHDVNNKKQPPSSNKKEEETVEVKEASNNKKAGTQEKQSDNRRGNRKQRTESDRWNHDLFRDEKQKPKSKSELINAYGYDIRQERVSRNYADNRPARVGNNTTTDRQQGSQENQRSRPVRDNRARQNQPINRSRERRPRRLNNRNRNEIAGTSTKPRDAPNTRPIKPDMKDVKQDYVDGKQSFQNTPSQSSTSSTRRDHQEGARDRVARNDNRGRRVNSKDRPTSNSADDKLPPITTVMPPITTWSNKIEDMVKEEASQKESPSRVQQPQQQHSHTPNNTAKVRSNDYWPQNQPNKTNYHDRSVRNTDDGRHQQQQTHYNSRRYQDREDSHKATQYVNRNQYNDRSNQHHHQEWRRTNNYSNYAKSNEYEPIKTQTFENSRLSQINMNRHRDAREIINERRLQNQQNFQSKVQPGVAGSSEQQQKQQLPQQRHLSHQQHQQQHPQQHQHQQQPQQPQHQHQHPHLQQLVQHQQQQHLQQLQHQQTLNLHQQQGHQQLRQSQPPPQQPEPSQQQSQQQSQGPAPPSQQLPNQRQHQQQASQPPQHATQQRQGIVTSNINDNVQESNRLNANNPPNTSDLINSRPIIKTDAYTGTNVGPHSQQPQPLQQHSQNHRPLGGSMAQQGPGTAGTHIVPSHLGAAGAQAQYYTPTGNSRDPTAAAAAAALAASAYHGYMASGHSVMDANRYHMTPQQLSDHGYIPSPGQASDVAATSVMLPQGMYSDAVSAGGTVASSAYLAQAGSTLSPSTNIPVTATGPPPLAPVSYLQHSQYAPPPYSNPYSQPQHNQAPPQSSHAYPYWTYI